MRKFRYIIEEECAGWTVQNYLRKVQGYSHNMIVKLKHDYEGVQCNSQHIRMVDLLHGGDLLDIRFLDKKSDILPNPHLQVPVLFEDDDVVVFNKPANMPVHPSRNHELDTLGNFFAYYYQRKTYMFRPVYRLDCNTSGICIIGKNRFAAKNLQGNIQKVYTAVVQGCLQKDGRIEIPIARVDGYRIKRCVDTQGQYALTRYRVVLCTDRLTVVSVEIETGRTHQIRVHFASIGHPLFGDDMYGGSLEYIERQALHLGFVRFCHPITSKWICCKAPVPQDMEALTDNFF